MPLPITSVLGTANQIDASPNVGRIVLSLDSNISVDSTIGGGSGSFVSSDQLAITSTFINPFGDNPGSSGSALQYNTAPPGTSWVSPPSISNGTWASGAGFYLRCQNTAGNTISEESATVQAFFRQQGPVVYATFGFSTSPFVTPGSFGNIAYFSCYDTNVNDTSNMPTPYFPYPIGGTGTSVYLGTIPVTSLTSGITYNGNCFIVQLQGNGFQCTAFHILPGGVAGGSSLDYFPPDYSSGYIFGTNDTSATVGNPVTFMYTLYS